MRILWDNKIIEDELNVSSENQYYPVVNLLDVRSSKVFRSISKDVTITFLTQITASYLAIVNHNISETAEIRIQGNNVNEWSNPAFNQVVTQDEAIIIHAFNEITFNFWRVVISDDDNLDGYIEIGFLYLGKYLQMPDIATGQDIPKITTAESSISYGGTPYGDDGYVYREANIKFPAISDTQKKEIEIMWKAVKNYKPIIVLIWALRLDIEPAMYSIIDQNNLEWNRDIDRNQNKSWSLKIKFREVF